MDRLDQFLTIDTRSRDRAALTSMVAGFSFGVLAGLIGFPFEAGGYGAAVVVCLMYIYQVARYCRIPIAAAVTPIQPVDLRGRLRRNPLILGYAAVFAVVLTIIAVLQEPKLEAREYDRRVGTLARNPVLSAQQVKELTQDLKAVRSKNIDLQDTTKVQVREAIERSAIRAPGLPNIRECANALATLSVRGDETRPKVNQAALSAIEQGEMDLARALRVYPARVDQQDALQAVDAFSRAIELLGNDAAFLSFALLERGNAYNYLNKPNEALADAEAAASLGELSLASLVAVESTALVKRGQPNDLRRAIDVLTVGIQIDPPPWVDPAMRAIYPVEQLGRLAIAYRRLGQFNNAIESCKRALELTHNLPPGRVYLAEIGSLYRTMILSYLQFGDAQKALDAVSDFLKISQGDPEVNAVYLIVREYLDNPAKALDQIARESPGWDWKQ